MKALLTALMIAGMALMPVKALSAEIAIGLLCPLTGKWASEGQDMKNIVTLLLDNYNEKAKKAGKDTLKLVVEDDAGDPRSAALAAQKLAASKVAAVIGTYGSAVTEATQNILAEAGIVQVATGSTSVRLTEKGIKTFFRTCPRDDSQGLAAGGAIAQKGYKAVALLHDNSSYSKGLAQETQQVLKTADVKIVIFDALTPGERDYSSILTKLKRANPDLIFFTGYYPETGMLLRQRHEMRWNVPMMGGDGSNHQDLVKIAGNAAAAGYFFISPPLPQDLDSPQARQFLRDFKARYNSLPVSVWAVLAGDAFNVIADAVSKGKTASKDMAAYFTNEMKSLSGLTGEVSFNAKGDRQGDFYRVYVVDGKGGFVLQPK